MLGWIRSNGEASNETHTAQTHTQTQTQTDGDRHTNTPTHTATHRRTHAHAAAVCLPVEPAAVGGVAVEGARVATDTIEPV